MSSATAVASASPISALMPVSYASITNVQATGADVDTSILFDAMYVEGSFSPIDQFIENTNAVNLIYLTIDPLPPALGPLVLLGYMSAVESFLRALLRGIVNLDEHAGKLVEPMGVPFGAALHLKRNVLAEALLEDFSFAGTDGVKDAIRIFAGVKGKPPSETEKAFVEYQKICEMRHCCVHRFGKLGAKNAIRLGLDLHGKILEKPLVLSKDALQDISISLRGFAKVVNNYLFRSIMERTVVNKNDNGTERLYRQDWSWKYKEDRARFGRYYKLFATTTDTSKSRGAKELYDSLKVFADSRKAKGKPPVAGPGTSAVVP